MKITIAFFSATLTLLNSFCLIDSDRALKVGGISLTKIGLLGH